METLNQVLNTVQLIKMKLNLSVYIHKAVTTMKLKNKMLIFQISQICFCPINSLYFYTETHNLYCHLKRMVLMYDFIPVPHL